MYNCIIYFLIIPEYHRYDGYYANSTIPGTSILIIGDHIQVHMYIQLNIRNFWNTYSNTCNTALLILIDIKSFYNLYRSTVCVQVALTNSPIGIHCGYSFL